jgi:hypothetical protein
MPLDRGSDKSLSWAYILFLSSFALCSVLYDRDCIRRFQEGG